MAMVLMRVDSPWLRNLHRVDSPWLHSSFRGEDSNPYMRDQNPLSCR